jgi:hypothetical protein
LDFPFLEKHFLAASCKVSYGISKQKKPRTAGEISVEPRTVEMAQLVCGPDPTLLPNDVMPSTTVDVSFNISENIVKELAASPLL